MSHLMIVVPDTVRSTTLFIGPFETEQQETYFLRVYSPLARLAALDGIPIGFTKAFKTASPDDVTVLTPADFWEQGRAATAAINESAESADGQKLMGIVEGPDGPVQRELVGEERIAGLTMLRNAASQRTVAVEQLREYLTDGGLM